MKMSDIYFIEFEPNKLSYQQEELGITFADLDTAVELSLIHISEPTRL